MDLKTYKTKIREKNPNIDLEIKQDLAYQIGREIERNRVERNLTQLQLAEAIGTKQSGISRLENGAQLPNLTTLKKIADHFKTYLEVRFGNPNFFTAINDQEVSEKLIPSFIQRNDLSIKSASSDANTESPKERLGTITGYSYIRV
ncbi:MAG: helix-turn-helix transcriptional regulator [Candidatus Pacebacteria bacterium]|nr:helix-turn-helix transcriptional regulator [Candidatus Paceibacterota bacterium]